MLRLVAYLRPLFKHQSRITNHDLQICAVVLLSLAAAAQTLEDDLRDFVQIPAIPGYEQELAAKISARLQAFKPTTDEMANVIVSVGTGSPRRLIVAPMDEPGYVVSAITRDGYLRLQRLPQGGSLPLFNELHSAQPVKIGVGHEKWISGAVAGLSIHLQPQVQHPLSLADLDNMYVDVGADNEQQAQAAGVDLLNPLVMERNFYEMANGNWTSGAIGDRFGDAVLVELVRKLDAQKLKGTLTVAFLAQQWTEARGLDRMLASLHPDELIYVGRLIRRPPPAAGMETSGAESSPAPVFTQGPGSGVLLGVADPAAELTGLAAELKQLAAQNRVSFHTDFSAPLAPPVRRGSLPRAPLPARWVHLAVATRWPSTSAEVLNAHDLADLATLLEVYLQGLARKPEIPTAKTLAEPKPPAPPSTAPGNEKILQLLIESYGVSGHEKNVREVIAALLPPWAKPQTDISGNLVLDWGAESRKPRVLVIAHQDEIGFEVRSVLPDGRLDLEQKGGAVLPYFLGHAAFVHSQNGVHPGIMELPEGWEKDDFKWPRAARAQFRADVGAHNPQEVAQLGIQAGDFVTIPKQYRNLGGMRASARAFDDRMGCAALISAAWALGPNLANRAVTFVWSTSEETGLIGAAQLAKRLAAEGHAPEYVFAVDTFVSSDSPLESKRFADAALAQGFVVRAVDNSNVVPRNLVEKLVSLAHANHIAAQSGVTGGGNDGSAFLQYGSTDIAIGWPLRYSHSPAEVIDIHDLDALAKIITVVAKSW